MSQHLASGGRGPRAWTRSDLRDDGVEVVADQHKARRERHKAMGGIRAFQVYANSFTPPTGLTHSQLMAWRRGKKREFDDLSAGNKVKYIQQAMQANAERTARLARQRRQQQHDDDGYDADLERLTAQEIHAA
eukprot:9379585-Pyramimonas_sp.AAC.1